MNYKVLFIMLFYDLMFIKDFWIFSFNEDLIFFRIFYYLFLYNLRPFSNHLHIFDLKSYTNHTYSFLMFWTTINIGEYYYLCDVIFLYSYLTLYCFFKKYMVDFHTYDVLWMVFTFSIFLFHPFRIKIDYFIYLNETTDTL